MEMIVLIYTDADFAARLQTLLTEQGYAVKIVPKAEEAEAIVAQCQPQLIILDALLPKLNGFELCRTLKAHPALRRIPIIMTSAIYISAEDRQQGIRLGTRTYPILADRCMMKPFQPAELFAQINYLLGKEVEPPDVPQILIVDDEAPVCELLRATLELQQYRSLEVSTGYACLALLKTLTPDLILLDYRLPDMTGLEVLKAIKQTSPDLPVVMMTAYSSEDVPIHAIAEHVDGYVRKPFLVENLLAVVTQTLERHRIERERRRLIAQLRESNREVLNRYEMLEQANRDLRTLDKLKSEFLANVGHELRTPLNSIIGFTELILQGYSGELNPEQRRQLTMVLNSGNQLLRVLNDVIEIAMLNAGQIELRRESIALPALIIEAIREVQRRAEKKKLRIFTEFDDALPNCDCGREKVRLILSNLLDNAIKFSASGDITVAAHATAQLADYHLPAAYLPVPAPGDPAAPPPHYLVVSVKDHGIGIGPQNFAILFDEFRQVDGSLTREYNGTGLGLAISKKLVELHGGHLWLESQVGRGTTFYFSLPLSHAE